VCFVGPLSDSADSPHPRRFAGALLRHAFQLRHYSLLPVDTAAQPCTTLRPAVILSVAPLDHERALVTYVPRTTSLRQTRFEVPHQARGFEAGAIDAQGIVGQLLVLFHASQSPTLYDASFMKTFRTRRGGVDIVRTYRDDSHRSDILAVDWSEDIRVTSSVCARKLTAS
jgi:hypothetical protein